MRVEESAVTLSPPFGMSTAVSLTRDLSSTPTVPIRHDDADVISEPVCLVECTQLLLAASCDGPAEPRAGGRRLEVLGSETTGEPSGTVDDDVEDSS
jgi:hypothetical protein